MSAPAATPPTPDPAPIGPGRIVLVAGPSGAGKDTIIGQVKSMCAQVPDVVFPRRVVTRPSGPDEDHDSLSDAAFDSAVNDGQFAVWWQAHGHKYGIPQSADADIRSGRTVVWNVSRGIVAVARARYANVTVVLITAPADVLSVRLSGRSRASDGSLASRMQRNDDYAGFSADHVIDNIGPPEAAARQLLAVIDDTVTLHTD